MKNNKELVFHFLGNAHLDPVWLWDKQEGLNEGIITCKMVIELMDEFPELTFNRGESLIYEHIEKNDPALFRKIIKYVEAGRWDIVGGSYIQQDNNLPDTETMIRGFLRGQSYFLSKFGKISEVGWSADCFGHSAGLPEIMRLAGIKYFAFTRPNNELFPISKPAFYWIGQAGAKILCYRPIGWYGSERFEIIPRIEKTIETLKDTGIRNIGIFYGLGDHGGGPTRKQIKEILKWREQNLDVKVIFSTMHRFFHALQREISSYNDNFLPKVEGELNFTLRGCYSSLAKLKFLYRKTQSQIIRAEKTQSIVSLKFDTKKQGLLTKAWDILLFNAFHDILPGTSIERACEEQIYELGSAYTLAKEYEFNTLNMLSQKIDTTVEKPQDEDKPSASPMLVWNPHPFNYKGVIEMETCLDWRPIADYKGRPDDLPVRILGPKKEIMPFQLVETESPRVMPDCPWRKRALLPVSIPPGGWTVFEMGWYEGAKKIDLFSHTPARALSNNIIDNSIWWIEAIPGNTGVIIKRNGKPIFDNEGLSAGIFSDIFGSWGSDSPTELQKGNILIEKLKITETRILESGPFRAALWVRMAALNSRIDLTFRIYAELDELEVLTRTFWNENKARLKLLMPIQIESADFRVPGATITRKSDCGDVPGVGWSIINKKDGERLGFVSNSIYNFSLEQNAFHITIVRSSGYAYSGIIRDNEPWIPPSDSGELKFSFKLIGKPIHIEKISDFFENPPVVLRVASKPGTMPKSGSLMRLYPDNLRLLAFTISEDSSFLLLRLQNNSESPTEAILYLLDKKIKLGKIKPREIKTWKIKQKGNNFIIRKSNLINITK